MNMATVCASEDPNISAFIKVLSSFQRNEMYCLRTPRHDNARKGGDLLLQVMEKNQVL